MDSTVLNREAEKGAAKKKEAGIRSAGNAAKRRLALFLAISLCGMACLCACSGRSGGTSAKTGARDQHEDEHAGKLKIGGRKYVYDDSIKSYLVIGTDYSGNEDAKGDEYVGSLADFLAVIIVNRTKKLCGVVEINRNTITDVNIIDRYGDGEALAVEQICTAHWYGGSKRMGCRNTEKAVSRTLGNLPIDGYYSLSLADIPKVNHVLGGVDVTVEDDFSKTDPSLKMGKTVHLTDEQALHYLQGRMEVGEGDNLSRMRRQETYLKAVLEKVSGDDGDYAMAVWDALEDDAVTDLNDRDISVLQKAYSEYQNEGFFMPEGETTEGETLRDGVMYEEFYMDDESLAKQMVLLCGLEPMTE